MIVQKFTLSEENNIYLYKYVGNNPKGLQQFDGVVERTADECETNVFRGSAPHLLVAAPEIVGGVNIAMKYACFTDEVVLSQNVICADSLLMYRIDRRVYSGDNLELMIDMLQEWHHETGANYFAFSTEDFHNVLVVIDLNNSSYPMEELEW